MKDISEKLGISISTVSHILGGRGERYSAKTQKKVHELVEELGYVPNPMARSLKGAKTLTAGVIVGGLNPGSGSEVLGAKTHAIGSRAMEHDYSPFICLSHGDQDLEMRLIRMLLAKQVDGLIIAPTQEMQSYHALLRRSVPFVILDVACPQTPFNFVVVDFEEGGYLITKHVLELGRKSPVFMTSRLESYPIRTRVAGWRKAVEEAGMSFDTLPLLLQEKSYAPEHEMGYALMKRHLETKRPFDCVVASNDMFALGVMRCLMDHGIQVPDDVAVTGFDDDQYASGLPVSLTTIRQPAHALGTAAFDILNRHIEDPSLPTEQVFLKPKLVVRRSTDTSIQERR